MDITGITDPKARICEKHFLAEDFGPQKKKKRLCADAVPTLFLHGDEEPEPSEEPEVNLVNNFCLDY